MTEQWEYKFLAFAPAEVAVDRLNEAGKDGWEAMSHVVEGVRLSVLLKRPLQAEETLAEEKPDLWADESDWPVLPKAGNTKMVDYLWMIRPGAIIPTGVYVAEEDLQEVARLFPNNIYFISREMT